MNESMLKRLAAWGVYLIAGSLVGGSHAAEASSLKPTHLRGIRHIGLRVYVDPELEGYAGQERAGLEREIIDRAQAMLSERGISTDGSDTTTLSVDVTTERVKRDCTADTFLVTVSVELREQVELLRDRAVKIPGHNGAITWSGRWVDVKPKNELREFVRKGVEWEVGLFADEVAFANK